MNNKHEHTIRRMQAVGSKRYFKQECRNAAPLKSNTTIIDGERLKTTDEIVIPASSSNTAIVAVARKDEDDRNMNNSMPRLESYDTSNRDTTAARTRKRKIESDMAPEATFGKLTTVTPPPRRRNNNNNNDDDPPRHYRREDDDNTDRKSADTNTNTEYDQHSDSVMKDTEINPPKMSIWMKNWMDTYNRLLEFKKEHGTSSVPHRYKADTKLAQWVHTQRKFCKEKVRIDLLNDIGFEWNVNDCWEVMYERLVTHKKKHGTTCATPKTDVRLAKWVSTQRRVCKEKDRVDLLNNIGFEWTVNTDWEVMYQRLLEYKKKHGTTRVPSTFKIDPQLAGWVIRQRHHCKIEDRMELLNEIGFEWRLSKRISWAEMYQRLLAFKMKYGTTSVPRKFKPDLQLGNWVVTQRRTCKEKDRIDLLNKIDFVWKVGKTDWDAMYQRLLDYKKEYGTTRVSKTYKSDPQLAQWVQTQRKYCKEQDRIDILNGIGFIWSVRSNNIADRVSDSRQQECTQQIYS